jgi:hypothetical protein
MVMFLSKNVTINLALSSTTRDLNEVVKDVTD